MTVILELYTFSAFRSNAQGIGVKGFLQDSGGQVTGLSLLLYYANERLPISPGPFTMQTKTGRHFVSIISLSLSLFFFSLHEGNLLTENILRSLVHRWRPWQPLFLQVLLEEMGMTSSMHLIFIPKRAPGPGISVLFPSVAWSLM